MYLTRMIHKVRESLRSSFFGVVMQRMLVDAYRIGCSEMSVKNCQPMLRKGSEER